MAVFAGIDLKKLRNEKNISAADLAERISCDTTTIYRYESGKIKPDPDVMFELCTALGDPDVWTTWMRTEYPMSYGRVHPETAVYNVQGALMSMFAEIEDVTNLRQEAMRDGADGHIDSRDLAKAIEKEVTEMIQSAQRVRSLIRKQEKDGEK